MKHPSKTFQLLMGGVLFLFLLGIGAGIVLTPNPALSGGIVTVELPGHVLVGALVMLLAFVLLIRTWHKLESTK